MGPEVIAMTLAATAATVSAVGAIRSAQATSASAQFNADVASQNAVISQQQSEAALQSQQRQDEQRQGAAIAAYGSSGVTSDSGSVVDVLSSNARNEALDRLTTKYNYQLKGLGYQDQGALDRANASAATQAGQLNATSALLNGSAKVNSFRSSTSSGTNLAD